MFYNSLDVGFECPVSVNEIAVNIRQKGLRGSERKEQTCGARERLNISVKFLRCCVEQDREDLPFTASPSQESVHL
jgi:hypothetical protein